MSETLTLETPPELPGESRGQRHERPFPPLSSAGERRLAQMFVAHFGAVWRLGRRLGLSNALAEEVAQDSFVVAARKIDQIVEGRERAYLYGVALRLAANLRHGGAMRHESNDRESSLSNAPDPRVHADQLLELKHQRITLDRVLDSMPERFREVLVLFEIEECSLSEIAEALGIPEGTAASRLRRAREDFGRRVQRLRSQSEEDQ